METMVHLDDITTMVILYYVYINLWGHNNIVTDDIKICNNQPLWSV